MRDLPDGELSLAIQQWAEIDPKIVSEQTNLLVNLTKMLEKIWMPYRDDTYTAALGRNLTEYYDVLEDLNAYRKQEMTLRLLAAKMDNTSYTKFFDTDLREVARKLFIIWLPLECNLFQIPNFPANEITREHRVLF